MSDDVTAQDIVNPVGGFPFVFSDAIVDTLKYWLPSHMIVPRPLRMTDGAASIGVYPSTWTDVPGTKEIGHIESAENRYVMKIQTMRKSMQESEGRALFANDSKLVRVILYRDPDLRLRLGGLQETLLGSVETVQRFMVARQNYESSELSGQFVYLSVTDYFIDTSITAQ